MPALLATMSTTWGTAAAFPSSIIFCFSSAHFSMSGPMRRVHSAFLAVRWKKVASESMGSVW